MRAYSTWPLAFLDIETTGLSPLHHDILEIAVVRTDGPPFVSKVKPPRVKTTATAAALEVNGYTDAEWSDAPTWGTVAPEVSKALNDCAIVGHNVGFDLGFLEPRLRSLEVPLTTRPRIIIDTMALAFVFLVPRGLTRLRLADVCEFLEIEPEDRTHRALAGAMSCKRVFEKLEPFIVDTVRTNDPETTKRLKRAGRATGSVDDAALLLPLTTTEETHR